MQIENILEEAAAEQIENQCQSFFHESIELTTPNLKKYHEIRDVANSKQRANVTDRENRRHSYSPSWIRPAPGAATLDGRRNPAKDLNGSRAEGSIVRAKESSSTNTADRHRPNERELRIERIHSQPSTSSFPLSRNCPLEEQAPGESQMETDLSRSTALT